MLIFAIAGAGAGAAYAATKKVEYSSTSELYVKVLAASPTTPDMVAAHNYARAVLPTYISLATTSLVLDPVREKVGFSGTSAELAASLTVTNPANTTLISVTARAADGEESADIARSVADQLAFAVQNELASAPPELGPLPVSLTVVEPATPSLSPSSVGMFSYLLAGAVGGLAVGLVVCLVLDGRRGRLGGRSGASTGQVSDADADGDDGSREKSATRVGSVGAQTPDASA